jgi:cytidine deaminase
VTSPDNEELIATAVSVLNPRSVDGRLFGDVGCALVTAQGDHFTGVCIDTGSGTGFCAEAAAIGAMVTAGQYEIAKIVAVWRGEDGAVYVLPPCGRCREFIRQIDAANLETQVVLGPADTLALRELLPRHEWPQPIGPAPTVGE